MRLVSGRRGHRMVDHPGRPSGLLPRTPGLPSGAALWAAGCVLVLLAALASPAPGETVERIVAVVEDQAILKTEVQARLLVEMEQRGVDPGDSTTVRQLRDLVIEGLIEQHVLSLHAQEAGITVPDAQVAQAVEEAIARNKAALGSEQLFQMQLAREGLTEAELRQRFADEARRTMLAERVVQSELGGTRPEVTPEEVRRYFEEHQAELPQREPSIHLQRIVILVEPDTSLVRRARDLAATTAARIQAGEITFADAASRYSDDPHTSRDGGNLHRLERGDLAGNLGPDFENEVFSLQPGKVSDPLRSPLGFHLFSVQERDSLGAWVQASHILFSIPVVRADAEQAEVLARRVREQALAGADFAELARQHSDAPEGGQGGELGWVPTQLLEERLQKALENLPEGQVSEVIDVEGAFILARVLGREAARPYAFEEIEQELTEHVRDVRIEERYRTWISGLKDGVYIERRQWE